MPTFLDGCPAAFDTAVTHPLHPSAQAPATVVAGAAAEARAVSKLTYYGEHCTARSWTYTAFVAETTGAVNQAGQRLVRKLTRAQALHSGEDTAEDEEVIWRSLVSPWSQAAPRGGLTSCACCVAVGSSCGCVSKGIMASVAKKLPGVGCSDGPDVRG